MGVMTAAHADEKGLRALRRRLVAAVAAGAALLLCALLAACAASPEEAVRQDLSKRLEQVKTGDDEFSSAFQKAVGSDLGALGIDPKEFQEAYLSGFDYAVGDVTVTDDTAIAKVTLTRRPIGRAVNDFLEKFQEEVAASGETDAEKLNKEAGALLVKQVKALKNEQVEANITYKKDGDTWKMDDAGTQALTQALLGDQPSS